MYTYHPKRGFTLIELLVVISIIAVLAAILFPVFARAREKARQSTCQSNQRQLAVGIQMWAMDHDELLPVYNKWTETVNDAKIYDCPSSSQVGGDYFYFGSVFNTGNEGMLSSSALGDIDSPNEIPLITDNVAGSAPYVDCGSKVAVGLSDVKNKMDLRHSNSCIVAWVDGHVSTVTNGLTNAQIWSTMTDRDNSIFFKWLTPVDVTFNDSGTGVPARTIPARYGVRFLGKLNVPLPSAYTVEYSALYTAPPGAQFPYCYLGVGYPLTIPDTDKANTTSQPLTGGMLLGSYLRFDQYADPKVRAITTSPVGMFNDNVTASLNSVTYGKTYNFIIKVNGTSGKINMYDGKTPKLATDLTFIVPTINKDTSVLGILSNDQAGCTNQKDTLSNIVIYVP